MKLVCILTIIASILCLTILLIESNYRGAIGYFCATLWCFNYLTLYIRKSQ